MAHTLKINNGKIFLDCFELKGVLEYEIKCSADTQVPSAELKIKLAIDPSLKLTSDSEKKKAELVQEAQPQKVVLKLDSKFIHRYVTSRGIFPIIEQS